MRPGLAALLLVLAPASLAQGPRASVSLGGSPVVLPVAGPVAIDTSGGYVAAAFVDALDVVYLVSSTDAGQSWSAPLALSSLAGPKTLAASSVRIAGYDANVCWTVGLGGGSEELWTTRVELAGAPPAIVQVETLVPHGGTPGPIGAFDVEVSSAGATRWLNVAQRVGAGAGHSDLWVSSSGDGLSFVTRRVATSYGPGTAQVGQLDLAADGARVAVAWSDDSGGATDVWLSIDHAGGLGTWSASAIRVDTSAAPATQGEGLSLALGAGRTLVAWNESATPAGAQLAFARVFDAVGAPLGATHPIATSGDADDCRALVTGAGNPLVLVLDDRAGPNEVWARVSKDGGATFESAQRLSLHGASSLSADAGGQKVVAAAWAAGPAPQEVEIAFSCDGGMTWSVGALSSSGGDADLPALAYDPLRRQVLGAWLSDAGGADRPFAAGIGVCLPPPPDCFEAASLGLGVPTPGDLDPGAAAAQSALAAGAADAGQVRLYRGMDYTPAESKVNGLRPLPAQRMTVFYPQGLVKPSGGWPVLLFSPCGAFRETEPPASAPAPGPGEDAREGMRPWSPPAALPFPLGDRGYAFTETPPLVQICAADEESGEAAPVSGFLYQALLRGWAVACVGTIGIDSRLDTRGKLVPFGGQLLIDRDPNLFYPADDGNGMPTDEWESCELFYGEKDFTWARQYLAEHAGELEIDDDLVVASGVSCGSTYAAFVALGPDRARTSGSSLLQQSTRCAGFLGFETPAWWPAFNDEVTAPHWEGASAGKRAATMADVPADTLARASVSRWIRESGSLAADTPALLVFDEGLAADAMADLERDDGNGGCGDWPAASGDPCLTDALLPCVDCNDFDPLCALLGLSSGCFCNPLVSRFCAGSSTDIIDYTRAHDSWNGIVLQQDLLLYGHPDSQLLLETGVPSAHPGLPALQTQVFTDTTGGFVPSTIEDPLVVEAALSWLCALRDDVLGISSGCAAATYRNAAPNPASLSVTPPVLGGTMACVVDLDTTGHTMAQVIGLDSPDTMQLATYVLLCQDLGSGILFQQTASGPIAIVQVAIPNGTYMVGSTLCVQAIQFGGGGADALSNAQDVVVGL